MGGNCYDTYNNDGVLIHKFGPHIFHTSNEDAYKFITQFTKLNNYVNKVLVNVDNKTFPLPINFKAIETICKARSKEIIAKLKEKFSGKKTITLFELKNTNDKDVQELYQYILKNVYINYSAKMWNKKIEEIDPKTIERVKIVLGYDHNYFPEDKYQGLPEKGYTDMINRMVTHSNIKLQTNTDALKLISFDNGSIKLNGQEITCPVVFCGSLDEILKYKFGVLPYRSLDIKFETLKTNKFQEVAVVNYPADPKMTRICEYKQMTLQKIDNVTTISKEYPGEFNLNSKTHNTRYYPIINPTNLELYNKHIEEFSQYKNFYPLGRLAQYKYYDMDDAINAAFELAKKIDHD
ncbi:MAG: UDP-galactopyranose mutase [Mycoplasmoidaceae bacterium]|nr:UDP-galactopyranose mutase [Mycoplasmoidaceae bacterium]